MFRKTIIPAALTVLIAASAVGGTAYAAGKEHVGKDEDGREITAILDAKNSLAQAIAAAEQETGGKAIDAELESNNNTMLFEVEVVKDKTVSHVLVDPQSGKVLKIAAADAAGEHEDEDED